VNRVLPILIVGFAALAPLSAQDFASDLEEAKALYREGRFGQTIARLQTLILRLQGDEGSLSPAIEAEAHLVTALAYVALDDRDAAKASFGQLLRLEPERRLDPEVHAPKVIAIFEEARRSLPPGGERPERPLASGNATTSSAPPPVESPSPIRWLLVGGAAGAGAAIAIGALSGGTTTSPFTTTVPPSIEIDARMNGVKQGTFSCSQGMFLSVDVINHSTTLVGVDGFDLTMNTISANCINHRPAIDGTVDVDVLPGARVQIRRADLGGDLCGPPGGVPGCEWRAVVVVVTNRGAFEDQILFNTIP
jgi:hypothetical protein